MPDLEAPALSDLAHEACIHSSMIEGLDALYEQTDGPEDCIISKRARNAMRPFIEAVIKSGWALTDRIELAERAYRPATDASVSIPILRNAAELDELTSRLAAEGTLDVTPA